MIKRIEYSDGDVIEYSSDEEDISAATSRAYTPMDIDPPGEVKPTSAATHKWPGAEGSGAGTSLRMTADDRSLSSGSNLAAGRQESQIHPKGNRKRQYVFDDAVIELTDSEDESAASTTHSIARSSFSGHTSPTKRIKFERPFSSAYANSVAGSSGGNHGVHSGPARGVLFPLKREPHAGVPEPHVPGAWPGLEPRDQPPGYEPNPLDAYRRVPAQANGDEQAVGGNPRVLDAEGHGALVNNLYSRSGFRMNYDDAGPVRKIDLPPENEAEKSVASHWSAFTFGLTSSSNS